MKKTSTNLDKLVCESCGNTFECGANVGKCWCFDVELKAETLSELRENFDKCLCPACLLKFEQQRKEKVS